MSLLSFNLIRNTFGALGSTTHMKPVGEERKKNVPCWARARLACEEYIDNLNIHRKLSVLCESFARALRASTWTNVAWSFQWSFHSVRVDEGKGNADHKKWNIIIEIYRVCRYMCVLWMSHKHILIFHVSHIKRTLTQIPHMFTRSLLTHTHTHSSQNLRHKRKSHNFHFLW